MTDTWCESQNQPRQTANGELFSYNSNATDTTPSNCNTISNHHVQQQSSALSISQQPQSYDQQQPQQTDIINKDVDLQQQQANFNSETSANNITVDTIDSANTTSSVLLENNQNQQNQQYPSSFYQETPCYLNNNSGNETGEGVLVADDTTDEIIPNNTIQGKLLTPYAQNKRKSSCFSGFETSMLTIVYIGA